MSLQTQLSNLATSIGTAIKNTRNRIGDLASLATTDKSNVVAAINEVKGQVASSGSGDMAKATYDSNNDGKVNSADVADNALSLGGTAASSYALKSYADSAAQAVKNDLLNGAGAAYDTLAELQALLEGEAASTTALTAAIGNRVRYDAAQVLSVPQQQQARDNIGAIAAGAIGDPETDLVAIFNAALL